jgi:CheY-like chemotaxis protein
MGGQININSKIGQGSEFIVTLTLDVDTEGMMDLQSIWSMKFGVCCRDTICPILRERIIHYLLPYGQIIDDFHKVAYDDLDMIFVFYNHDIIKRLRFIRETYTGVPIVFVGDLEDLSNIEKTYINEYVNEPLYNSKIVKLITGYYDIKWDMNSYETVNHYKGKVLVAEDNMVNQKLIEVLLSKHGISPIFASNGEEAVDLTRKEVPDLILMDIHMPIIDGIEATRIIREKVFNKTANDIPIIALTADVQESFMSNYNNYGFDDYLTKPINTVALNDILSSYLEINKADQVKTEYDMNRVEEYTGLEADVIISLIEMFFNKLDQHLIDIGSRIKSYDQDALKESVHSLKGSTSNLRLEEAANILQTMEEQIENKVLIGKKFTELIEIYMAYKKHFLETYDLEITWDGNAYD